MMNSSDLEANPADRRSDPSRPSPPLALAHVDYPPLKTGGSPQARTASHDAEHSAASAVAEHCRSTRCESFVCSFFEFEQRPPPERDGVRDTSMIIPYRRPAAQNHLVEVIGEGILKDFFRPTIAHLAEKTMVDPALELGTDLRGCGSAFCRQAADHAGELTAEPVPPQGARCASLEGIEKAYADIRRQASLSDDANGLLPQTRILGDTWRVAVGARQAETGLLPNNLHNAGPTLLIAQDTRDPAPENPLQALLDGRNSLATHDPDPTRPPLGRQRLPQTLVVGARLDPRWSRSKLDQGGEDPSKATRIRSLGSATVEGNPPRWTIERLQSDPPSATLLQNARQDLAAIVDLYADADEFTADVERWLAKRSILPDGAESVAEAGIRSVLAEAVRRQLYVLSDPLDERIRLHQKRNASDRWRRACERGVPEGLLRALHVVEAFEAGVDGWSATNHRVLLPWRSRIAGWLYFEERTCVTREYRRLSGETELPPDPVDAEPSNAIGQPPDDPTSELESFWDEVQRRLNDQRSRPRQGQRVRLLSRDLLATASPSALRDTELALSAAAATAGVLKASLSDVEPLVQDPGSWSAGIDAAFRVAMSQVLPATTSTNIKTTAANAGYSLYRAALLVADSRRDPDLVVYGDALRCWTAKKLKNFIVLGVTDKRAEPRVRARVEWWLPELGWMEALADGGGTPFNVAGDVLADTGQWLQSEALPGMAKTWFEREDKSLEALPALPGSAEAIQDLRTWYERFPVELRQPSYYLRDLEGAGAIAPRGVQHRMAELVLEHFIDIAQTRLPSWPRSNP